MMTQRTSSTILRTIPTVRRTVRSGRARPLLLAGACVLAAGLTACEPSSSPVASGSGGGAGGNANTADSTGGMGGIAGVGDSANSVPGQVVANARNLVDDINANQSRATGLAADIGGGDMVDLGTVRFPVPEGWTQVPPANSMRLGQLESPGGGEVTFSRFGGDFESNITRWIGQFSLTDSVERRSSTISGRRVDTVAVTGSYLDGAMTGTPTERSNWALYGAVIADNGPMIFVKFTGPADALEGDLAGYAHLLNGMQAE